MLPCLCCKTLNRGSSRPEVFCKKVVLKNFAKFTGKHLCQSLLFNKVSGPGSFNFLQKRIVFCTLYARGYTAGGFAPTTPGAAGAARRAQELKTFVVSQFHKSLIILLIFDLNF